MKRKFSEINEEKKTTIINGDILFNIFEFLEGN
jgi:hypothetical protein